MCGVRYVCMGVGVGVCVCGERGEDARACARLLAGFAREVCAYVCACAHPLAGFVREALDRHFLLHLSYSGNTCWAVVA